jgi:SlyX protein
MLLLFMFHSQYTIAVNLMQSDHNFDKRLTELEIKVGLADDLVDQLNQTIFRQQQQIEFLAKELASLRLQMPQERNTHSPNLRDELPPHY